MNPDPWISRTRKRTAFVVILLAVVFSMLLGTCCFPCAGKPIGGLEGKVVIILIDRVGIEDFPSDETPFCQALAEEWSVGLMITRTGERDGNFDDLGADYVSLGAGVQAKGSTDAGLSFNSPESAPGAGAGRTAGDLYLAFSGSEPPRDGVVCLGFQDILVNNEKAGYAENPGLLGRVLLGTGRRAAVAGNTDIVGRSIRLAPLICSDERGAVEIGDVSRDMLIRSSASPGGYRTDYARLLGVSERFLEKSDLLVVDTGDTGRIDRVSTYTDPDLVVEERRAALRSFDGAAAEFASLLNLESSLLLILSPGAPLESREEGNLLTPLIAAGGGMGSGLVTSASTRRPGLVLNTDVAPTVLEFLDIEVPSDVVGSAMETVEDADRGVADLRKLSGQLGVTRRARWPLVIAYAFFSFVFLCLLVFSVARRARAREESKRNQGRLEAILAPAAVVLLTGPLSFIVVSAFFYDSYLFPALFCALFSVAVGLAAWLLQRGRPRLDPVISVCALTAVVILTDLLMGGRLLLLPLLGVSALEGMRLYGLTNTMAGLLLACAIWGIAGIFEKAVIERGPKRWLVIILLLALPFTVGFGLLGANVGGFIAALATSLVFIVATSDRGFKPPVVLLIAGVTVFGTGLMILLDSLFIRTHAGRALAGGSGGLLPIVERKIAIQFGQINFFLLPTLVLIVAVLAVVVWLRRPGSFWSGFWKEERSKAAALFSLAVGSLVALIFNDTGAAMLAAMSVVSVLVTGYYLVQPFERSGERSGYPLFTDST